MTQLPSADNNEGSGMSANDELLLSSLNNPEVIEIKELGSPVMERLLWSPVNGNNEPLPSVVTVTMPTVAVITQTQTIKLLGANCVPQCLFTLPKCRATL